jgi:hypothetical protein
MLYRPRTIEITREGVSFSRRPRASAAKGRDGFPVATADASRIVKRRAKFVTRGSAGTGLVELIDELLRDDLRQVVSSLPEQT